MKIYIAGPMRGYKDLNFPEFNKWARILRKKDHEVVNPAELDKESKELADTTMGQLEVMSKEERKKIYKLCMKRDLQHLLTCDAVVLLEGWQDSVGALLELKVALNTGLKILDLPNLEEISEQALVNYE